MDAIEAIVHTINSILFSNVTIFALLFTGVLFTILTKFGQLLSVSHGISILRGKYDNKDDPGAISHFQALSAALSATVGLGNIGGVALAVALGGPGAVFWMWVIGFFGMALKITEVTQSMLSRRFDEDGKPHGGPMYVAREGFEALGSPFFGKLVATLFCVAVVIAAVTGGNMFQAWNVATVTQQYFPFISREVVGFILAAIVCAVIIGGIERIGAVAGTLVPFMCGIYVIAGLIVIGLNVEEVPAMLSYIVSAGLGFEEVSAQGAFFGASLGMAFMWGVKRALFSSEAGWGSAPIAHSAAKTDEPVREGIVAGLEPLIDTLVVCTITALVILLSGAWNRPAVYHLSTSSIPVIHQELLSETGEKRFVDSRVSTAGVLNFRDRERVFIIASLADGSNDRVQVLGTITADGENSATIEWDSFPSSLVAVPHTLHPEVYMHYAGAGLTAHAFDRVIPGLGMWLVITASWLFAISTMISWSYYGEQGVYYLCPPQSRTRRVCIFVYKLLYVFLIFVATLPFIHTDEQLDMWTTLGMGCMLVVNIPIMLLFGLRAMRPYHNYRQRLRDGAFRDS